MTNERKGSRDKSPSSIQSLHVCFLQKSGAACINASWGKKPNESVPHVERCRGKCGSPSLYGSPASSLAISLIHLSFGFKDCPPATFDAMYIQLRAFPTVCTSSLTCVLAYSLIRLYRSLSVTRLYKCLATDSWSPLETR
jgi:hypothetical protein